MKKQPETDLRVKKKPVGWRQFGITYSIMLLLVGIQMGILVLPAFQALNSLLQVGIIMGYWALLALVFGFITNHQIRLRYDKPMRKLSSAAKKVAEGDFSVYVEPLHTSEQYDYIDVMFTDFNVMVQELGSIETLKNDFIANVSHEIKTPLAVIKSYSTMLKRTDLPDQERIEYLNAIGQAADRLSTLVSNILKLNKLENQQIEAVPESYDLCRQLCDCALGFEALWEEKNISFEVDLEDRATITAEESMLELVWNNLLSNALKFTEPGGTVTLRQTSDEETVTVTVTDTGCGMNEATLRHIFDKFYQGDSSHSGEGNGLGLALTQRVVERLNGTISVTSTTGTGSTFTVTLPTAQK